MSGPLGEAFGIIQVTNVRGAFDRIRALGNQHEHNNDPRQTTEQVNRNIRYLREVEFESVENAHQKGAAAAPSTVHRPKITMAVVAISVATILTLAAHD